MSGNAILRRSVKIPAVLLVVFMWASSNSPVSNAIWLNVPATGTKCISEEIQPDVIVLSDYVVVPKEYGDAATISVMVTSPYGNNLHYKENVTHGQFAFTTQESGNYLACFWLGSHPKGAGEISVNLDWKTGIPAKELESVAKKERLEGVELELKKLEGVVESIHENLLYLKEREANLRVTSENTNTRVALFSIMALGVCIVASGMQIWYLKRYFQKKKLI